MSEKKQKSILSFFNKTPNAKSSGGTTPSKSASKPSAEKKKSPILKENVKDPVAKKLNLGNTPKKTKKSRIEDKVSDASDEELKIPPRRSAGKRRRAIIESDSEDEKGPEKRQKSARKKSEDDDFKLPGEAEESSEDDMDVSIAESADDTISEPDESPVKSKKKPASRSKTTSAARNRNLNSTMNDMSIFAADDEEEADGAPKVVWTHEELEWLKPKNIKDNKGRRTDDVDYDPTTLHVPDAYIKSLTPGMGNWWKIKSRNFDVVIFYKVGKFYELYHMDAVIGVQNCGVTFMKGKYAHAGFPEMRFDHFASMLVTKGFKVARVEQTETQEKNKERVKESKDWKGVSKKLDKFEKQTRREVCAIVTPGTRVAAFNSHDDFGHKEGLFASIYECEKTIGVALVDTSMSEIIVGQFGDDTFFSNLRTLLSQRHISQLMKQKKACISPNLHQVLAATSKGICSDDLPEKAFLDVDKTKKIIREIENDEIKLDKLLEICDANPVGTQALGALLTHLKRYEIIHEILRTSTFVQYETSDRLSKKIDTQQRMIMDAATLVNLGVTQGDDGSERGSLLRKLDTCCSAGGKRKLWETVISPPANPDVIRHRQECIKALMDNREFCKDARKLISGFPDIARLISRFGNLSIGIRPSDHPDKRAVMYEEILYNRQKTRAFCRVLSSFKDFDAWIKQQSAANGDLLKILQLVDNDNIVIEDLLSNWRKTFDMEKAKREEKLTPKEGANPPFDRAVKEIKRIQDEAEAFRTEVADNYGHAKLLKSGKLHFVIQVRDTVKAPNEWTSIGLTKGFKKYQAPELDELNKEMDRYVNLKDMALSEASSVIFGEFYKTSNRWLAIVKMIDELDALISFANYGHTIEERCFPEVLDEGEVLSFTVGKHPTVDAANFIPNDVDLEEGGKCILLTGPNMGGKSTILRQIGLLTMLAHYGCAVPAESMQFSPVDRIFTRLGCSDRLLAGESTFMVEMAETSSILKSSTKRSLLLLDELGRGTSTHDGSSIAQAVLETLSARNVRTVFSTHYHTLCLNLPAGCVSKHMSCHVEKDEETGLEKVTFLYTLSDGHASRSHGFHAARSAGLPDEVILAAQRAAKDLQKLHNGLQYINHFKRQRFDKAKNFKFTVCDDQELMACN